MDDSPLPFDPHPPELLDAYLAVMQRRAPGSLPATALRTRSLAARALLARAAAGAHASVDGLLAAARAGRSVPFTRNQIRPQALCDLARVVALQGILATDTSDGLALYDLVLGLFGPDDIPQDHQGIHAQLAYSLGDWARAAALCERYRQMPERVRRHLQLDLTNPFAHEGSGSEADWLASFRRLLPTPQPTLTGDTELAPFDRLTSVLPGSAGGDELVSVIVTSYRPDVGLITAVRSLVEQSWENLEILLIDDASPPEYDKLLEACLAIDDRIRLIKLSSNAGTYVARNAGLDAASGQIVTTHDYDDWSHPHRIAHQVEPLLRDPSLVATISYGLKVTHNFVITQPGRDPRVANTSSMMLRRNVVVPRVGYFDSVRKAADSEYLSRIGASFGETAIHRLNGDIYALLRQTPESLSRSEFGAGWIHPARAAYRSAYGLWHEQIRAETAEPYLPNRPVGRPFPAPAHLRIAPAETTATERFDVIFAGEWRAYGGPQKSMLEEIRALTRCGAKVGIMQLEAYRFMTKHRKPLCRQVQELVNNGTVRQVLLTDRVEVSLLVIRYPPVLQFAANQQSCVRPKRLVILANQAPHELDGSDVRYSPATCTETAKQMFSVDPLWCPQGPLVRDMLEPALSSAELADFDIPGIIDLTEWCVPRSGFRSDRPVIGRHSRDNWTKWPGSRAALLHAYPASPDVDVRVMGGADAVRAVLNARDLPPNWLVYDYDEVTVHSFLHQIDFFVYFPHPDMVEAFGRAVLEALAAGCVVILPPHFSRTFGEAAVYCAPDDVMSIVRAYYADRELYLAQTRRARAWVEAKHSYDAYLELVAGLIGSPGWTPGGDRGSADGCRVG